MGLTVHVPSWYLEEDGAVIAVGDTLSTWLKFSEGTRWDQTLEQQQRLTGLARPVPDWPGAEFGRNPTVIEADDATVYWDAPGDARGPVEVVGVVSANNVVAPDGFPETDGVVTRVRMEWQEYRLGDRNVSYPVPGTCRYEDLRSSYLPRREPPDSTTHPYPPRFVWTGVVVDLDTTGNNPS